MAQIETVLSATQTEADADDSQLSPTQTEPGATVNVVLRFKDVNFDPSDLYDALNTQWPTVAANKVNARGTYEYVISS